MKKKTTLLCAVMALGLFSAHADMVHKKFSMLDSPEQSTIQTLKSSGDYIYTFANFGTSATAGTSATFLNQTFTGVAYASGNSYGKNLLVVKHDADGNVSWTMNSNKGDIDASGSGFIPTSDGGVFLALDTRYTGGNEFNDDVIFQAVNSDGTTTTVTFDCSFWTHQPLFVKVDNQGDVEWTKLAYCDTTARPNATTYNYGTPDAFDIYDVAVDNAGNYYVVGRIKADFTIDNITIPSHNNATWDGNSQESCGNAFILKLDSDGDYVSHIVTSGSAEYDQLKAAIVHNGKLYVAGMYKGDGTNSFGLGDRTLTVGSENGMWVACLNLDLSALWATAIPGATVNNKNSIQLETMNFNTTGDRFYLGGGVQGGIVINETKTVSSKSSMYNSFVVEVDANNGSVLNGVVAQNNSIGKVYGIVANSDSIYVYGYDWGRSGGGQIYLDSYDLTLTPICQYALANNSNMPTAWGCAVDGDKMVVAFRGRYEFTFPGSEETYNKNYFQGGLLFLEFPGYDFDESATGPSTGLVNTNSSEVQVYSQSGHLLIAGAEGQDVSIFNATGACVAHFTATNSTESISLPQGFYVVRAGATCKKALIQK